jgi:hypothetical protein
MIMSNTKKAERAKILCEHVIRNAAFHRAMSSAGIKTPSEFWKTAQNNFLDVSILEWSKLFCDVKGKYYWKRLSADARKIELGLIDVLKISKEDFDSFCTIVKRYRDRFLAHLDTDDVMEIPFLDIIIDSTIYLHTFIKTHYSSLLPFGSRLLKSAETFYQTQLQEGITEIEGRI